MTHAKRCEQCGQAGRSGDAICRFCFGSLREAPAATAARPRSRRPAILKATLGALVAFVLLGVAYRTWIDPPPLPTAASRERTAASADNGRTRTSLSAASIEAPVAWRQTLPSRPSAPIASDGVRIFVPLADGHLAALSMVDGGTVWSLQVPGQLDHPAVVAGDFLYFGQRDGELRAVEAASGRTRWSRNLGGWILGAPIVLEGTVYAIASASLVALDAEDGTVLWSRELESPAVISPAATDTEIAIGTFRRIFLYDRATGENRYQLDTLNVAGLAFHQDTVVGLSARVVVAIEPGSRSPWWESRRNLWFTLDVMGVAPTIPPPPHRWITRMDPDRPTGGDFRPTWPEPHPFTFWDSMVYVSWPRGTLRAHDLRSGEVVWERSLDPITAAPVTTAAGLLMAVPGALVLLDPATGDEVVRRELAGGSLEDIVVTATGTVAVADREVMLIR